MNYIWDINIYVWYCMILYDIVWYMYDISRILYDIVWYMYDICMIYELWYMYNITIVTQVFSGIV